jgi:excinuclease UvrABC nuclease subunit
MVLTGEGNTIYSSVKSLEVKQMNPEVMNLLIRGYWLEKGIELIPNESGIYFVYEATDLTIKKIIYINRLIYIGEADRIRERIISHEKWNNWKKYVKGGSQLCFSYALIEPALRNRIKAALIFKHKPPTNDKFRFDFPFETTTIKLEGKTCLLEQYYTLHKMTQSF